MVVRKPPMGWNSWNTFAGAINEKLIMEMADVIVEKGLKDAGYEYVVIDDCWSLHERDENGKLVADPEKFPHGMKYVSDYIHSKGLKFGMYSCCGTLTCAGFPGSYDHEYTDARTFAEWGVDFLKYDNCFAEVPTPTDIRYKRMGLALQNCGRDILFSACSWGSDDSRVWIKEVGAGMWRSTYDIADSFVSIRKLIKQEMNTLEYNGQGCFNDLDMLVVGMGDKGYVAEGGCTYDEYALHFAFWCLFGSPLMIGCDLRNVSDEYIELLKNPALLRIDQDEAYRQPFSIKRVKNPDKIPYYNEQIYDDCIVLCKYLSDGKIALGFFNLADTDRYTGSLFASLEFLGITPDSGMNLKLTDVFTGEENICKNDSVYVDKLFPHSCKLFIGELVKK